MNSIEPEYLTVFEVSKILRCTEATVLAYHRRERNPLPGLRVSPKKILFSAETVNRWLLESIGPLHGTSSGE